MNFRDKLKQVNTNVLAIASLLLICLFVYLIFFHGWIRQGVTGMLWPSIIVITAALISEDLLKKEIRPLSFLGDISYSLYLVHWIVIRVTQLHFPELWKSMHNIGGVILFVVVCITISFITYRYIERPAIKLARKITS